MDLVIISNNMTARQPDGSTVKSLHIVTLQITVIPQKDKQIHISPKVRTYTLI